MIEREHWPGSLRCPPVKHILDLDLGLEEGLAIFSICASVTVLGRWEKGAGYKGGVERHAVTVIPWMKSIFYLSRGKKCFTMCIWTFIFVQTDRHGSLRSSMPGLIGGDLYGGLLCLKCVSSVSCVR